MDMVTLNISLPQKLAQQVDLQVASGEFASRSEFIRTLLRLYEAMTGKTQVAPLEFIEFKKRPIKEIEAEFLATGKYSKKFVKGIIAGLSKSSVYANS